MSELNLNMQLPVELIEGAVRDKITAAITRELGDPGELIRKQVALALSQKVDSDGKLSKYSSDNRFSFLEANANNLLRDAAREALIEFFSENKNLIKEAVKKEILKSPGKMAKIFMDGITNGMTATYGSSVNITFENKDRY